VLRNLKEVKRELHKAEKEFLLKKAILQRFTILEKTCLISLLKEKFQQIAQTTITTHRKKLLRLWIRQRNKSPNCIINLSHKKLSIREEESLWFGLDHHTLPRKVNADNIKANIEQFLYSLKRNKNLNIDEETCDEIKLGFRKFVQNSRRLSSDKRNIALH